MSRRMVTIVIILAAVLLFIYVANTRRFTTGDVKPLPQAAPLRVTLSAPSMSLLQKAEKLMAEGNFDEAVALIDSQLPDFAKDTENIEDVVALLLLKADIYEARNNLLGIKGAYQTILRDYPNTVLISEIQEKWESVNMKILFSKVIDEERNDIRYEVQSGDTLGKIAQQFNVSVELLRRANGLTGDLIRVGDNLKIPGSKFSVLVDKSLNTLFLKANGDVIKTYTVATGKDNFTPQGEFTIVNKLSDPVWYKAGAIVPPESPDNILGSRWLGISKPGYGIHGTTDPDSIGQNVTQGCIRMRNADVEELYAILSIGTEVVIIE
ncbi:MAG: L,D-transpeptidase family protein [Candidatus Omnitrophica bacterium]|nr:L,D-transpeptidase family protein [Candidatus Omnitrophota bacterium]